jgi:hypothetical protein
MVKVTKIQCDNCIKMQQQLNELRSLLYCIKHSLPKKPNFPGDRDPKELYANLDAAYSNGFDCGYYTALERVADMIKEYEEIVQCSMEGEI